MEATQKKIGAQIAALRRAKGLTQEQLAEMLGVSAPAVSKWETDSSYPDITLLCPRALGTNLDTLLQFEEDLPDKEVIDRINALMEQTIAEGSPNGWKKAEEGLEELLCRWPGCALLLYNGAAVYDNPAGLFPRGRGRKFCPLAGPQAKPAGKGAGLWLFGYKRRLPDGMVSPTGPGRKSGGMLCRLCGSPYRPGGVPQRTPFQPGAGVQEKGGADGGLPGDAPNALGRDPKRGAMPPHAGAAHF